MYIKYLLRVHPHSQINYLKYQHYIRISGEYFYTIKFNSNGEYIEDIKINRYAHVNPYVELIVGFNRIVSKSLFHREKLSECCHPVNSKKSGPDDQVIKTYTLAT